MVVRGIGAAVVVIMGSVWAIHPSAACAQEGSDSLPPPPPPPQPQPPPPPPTPPAPPAAVPPPPLTYEPTHAPPSHQPVEVALDPLTQQEIARLEEERRTTALGGPITLLSIGGGGALLFGIGALAWANDDSVMRGREAGVVVFGALAFTGLVLAVLGVTGISGRLEKRAAIDARLEELRGPR